MQTLVDLWNLCKWLPYYRFVLNMHLDNWKLIACRDYMNYPLHGWNIYMNTWFFLGQVLRKYKGLRTLVLVISLRRFRASVLLCNFLFYHVNSAVSWLYCLVLLHCYFSLLHHELVLQRFEESRDNLFTA